MICPNCGAENSDSAKFCKKCGNSLEKKPTSHQSMIDSMNKEKNDNTKIIIAALVVVVVVLAGAFVYLQGFGTHNDSGSSQSDASSSATPSSSNDDKAASSSSSSSASTTAQSQSSSSMKILGGSFYTGTELSDLTYASIYVGKENAGKSVIVQIWYSRDGNTLNNGNMVPATVHSDGYLEISSADAYSYYPDHATINLYDSSSNLMDTKSVSLSPSTGTQTF